MDLKQIEKLMQAMEESRIKRLALKKEGFEIEIERECQGGQVGQYTPPPTPLPAYFQPHPTHPSHPPMDMKHKSPHGEQHSHTEAKEKVQTGIFVTSPMVGTYYASPSPDDAPFIKVGDTVSEGTVVCIIEAMKVMNEVKAGCNGKIAEVLLHSGDPVEFGTRIFRIEPA